MRPWYLAQETNSENNVLEPSELVPLAHLDVVPEYPDMLVTIHPRLLVPEARGVQDLMEHHAMVYTPTPQGYQLKTK